MSKTINIPVQLTLGSNIQAQLKQLQNTIKKIGSTDGLSDGLKDGLSSVSNQAEKLQKQISNIGKTKVNIATFADLQQRVTALESSVGRLHEVMNEFASSLSGASQSNFQGFISELTSNMTQLGTATKTASEQIQQSLNIKQNNSSVDSIQQYIDVLKQLQKFSNQKSNIGNYDYSGLSLKQAKKDLQDTISDFYTAQEKLSTLNISDSGYSKAFKNFKQLGQEVFEIYNAIRKQFGKIDNEVLFMDPNGFKSSVRTSISDVKEMISDTQKSFSSALKQAQQFTQEVEKTQSNTKQKRETTNKTKTVVAEDVNKTTSEATEQSQKISKQVDAVLVKINQIPQAFSKISLDISSSFEPLKTVIDEITTALKTLEVDTSGIDRFKNAIEQSKSAVSEITTLLSEIYNSSFASKVDALFDKISAKAQQVTSQGLKLNTKEGKSAGNELVEMWNKYISAGGDKTVADLQASKSLQKYISSRATGVVDQGDSFQSIKKAVEQAAVAATQFTESNNKITTSANETVGAIKNEADAISNIGKALNKLGGEKSDEKLNTAVENLKKLFETLNTPIDNNSALKSIEKLSMAGDNLKDLATALLFSENATRITNMHGAFGGISKDQEEDERFLLLLKTRYNQLYNLRLKLQQMPDVTDQVLNKTNFLQGLLDDATVSADLSEYALEFRQIKSEIDLWVRQTNQNKQLLQWDKILNTKDIQGNFAQPLKDKIEYAKGLLSHFSEKYKNVDFSSDDAKADYVELESVMQQIQKDMKNPEYNVATAGSFADNLKTRQNQLDKLRITLKQDSKATSDMYAQVDKLAERLSSVTTPQELKNYDTYAKSIKSSLSNIISSAKQDKQLVEWNEILKADDIQTQFIQPLKDKINKAKNLIAQFGDFKNIDFSDTDVLNKYQKLESLMKQIQADMKNPEYLTADSKQIENLDNDMSRFLVKSKGMSDDYITLVEKMREALKNVNSQADVDNIKQQFTKLQTAAQDAGETIKKSFGQQLEGRIKQNALSFIAQYFSFQDITRYAREIAQSVIDVDSALIELQKVSDATNERLQQTFETSAQTAQELGTTITDVINSTADWSRLGYTVDEAEELARVTTLFQTVGDDMTQETASDAMIATMKAFDVAVSDSESLVDRYNSVANNFSLGTDDLADALQRSGSALSTAGNTIEQSMGMIVAANTSVQNAESVGTFLKTMSMRLRGASASDLQELGIDTTGMTDSTKSIVQQMKAMAGIDIMDGATYKSTYQVLDELADKWADLTDAEQAAITEAIAGKRGGNVMSSLMQNWADAEAAAQTALNSEGSAAQEQEHYAQSVQYSVDRVKASLEELSVNFLNSDMLKGLIEGFNVFLQLVNTVVQKLGSMKSIILAVTGMSMFKSLLTGQLFNSKVSKERQNGAQSILKSLQSQFLGKGDKSTNATSSKAETKTAVIDSNAFNTAKESGEKAGENLAGGVADGIKQNSGEVTNVAGEVVEDAGAVMSKSGEAAGKKAGIGAVKGWFSGLSTIQKVMTIASVVTIAASVFSNIVNSLQETYEQATSSFEEAQANVEQAQSKLDEYNDTLTTNKDRIAQLQEIKGTSEWNSQLQEELNSLQQQNSELERQISLRQQLVDTQTKKAGAEAIDLYNKKYESDAEAQMNWDNMNWFQQGVIKIAQGLDDWIFSGAISDMVQQSRGSTDIKKLEAIPEQLTEAQAAYQDALAGYELTQKYYESGDRTIQQLQAANQAITQAKNDITTLNGAGAEYVETLTSVRDAMKAADPVMYADEISRINKAIKNYNNIGKNSEEIMKSNVDAMFDGSTAANVLKNYLAEMIGKGASASDVLLTLGYDVVQLNAKSGKLDDYFEEFITGGKKAIDVVEDLSEFSDSLADVKAAFESENSDSDYEELVEYYEKAKQAWEKTGKVGTDDFRSFVDFMSPGVTGEDGKVHRLSSQSNVDSYTFDADAYTAEYDRMQAKFERYLKTDDDDPSVAINSMNHALDDLVTSGLATQQDGVFNWTEDFNESADAAKAWGVSVQAAEAIMHNLESYGFEFGNPGEEDGVFWNGEALEEYKSSLDSIHDIYDSLLENDPDGAYTKSLEKMLEDWDSDYSLMEQDINNLTEDQVVKIKAELQVAQAREQLAQIDNLIQLGQDDSATMASGLAAQKGVIEQLSNNASVQNSTSAQSGLQQINALTETLAHSTGEAKTQTQQDLYAIQGVYIDFLDQLQTQPDLDWSSYLNTDKAKQTLKNVSDQVKKSLGIGEVQVPVTTKLDVDVSNAQELGQKIKNIQFWDGTDDTVITFKANVNGVEKKIEALQAEQGVITYRCVGTDGITDILIPLQNVDGTITYYAEGSEEVSGELYELQHRNGVITYTTDESVLEGYTYDQTRNIYVQTDASAAAEEVGSVKTELDSVPSTTPANISTNASSAKGMIHQVKTELDSLNGKTVTTTINTQHTTTYSTIVSPTVSAAAASGSSKKKGKGGLIGTAHGTGSAFLSGYGQLDSVLNNPSNQTKHTANALVGELGPELVAHGNEFWTVGDNGAEFADIPSGSVIFDAYQTRKLLEQGSINTRGRAYLRGTAYSSGYSTNKARGGRSIGTYLGANGSTVTGISKSVSSAAASSASAASSAANAASSAASASSDVAKAQKNTFDWIEILLDRIQRNIDHFNSIMEDTFFTFANRLEANAAEINEVETKRSATEQAYQKYLAQANSIGLSETYAKKVRDGNMSIEDIIETDPDNDDPATSDRDTLNEKISLYQQWYQKALEMQQALDDLRETEEDLMSTRHDLIEKEYEGELEQLQVWADTMQDFIDLTEEQAHIVDRQYYDELITNTTEKLKLLQEESDNLMADMYYAALNGLAEGSEEWNEMSSGIADVDAEIREATKDLVEFKNAIRQLEWDAFDRLTDAIDNFNNEIEFAYDLLDEDLMWDDNGHITEEGLTGLSLLASSYDTLMRKAEEYGTEVTKINEEIANDPNNTDLLDRRQELLEAQQSAIKSANSQKEAIKSLVNDGFDKEIDSIENLIDAYEQLLDDQQDQHDYAQNIASQQKTINNLQKQLMAWSTDDSEEGRANRQKTEQELKEAQEALQESQADRRVSEIKETLSDLTSQLQEAIDAALSNTDSLIQSVIDSLNNGTIVQELGEGGAVNTSILWNGQQIAAGFESYLGENSSMLKIQEVFSSTLSDVFNSVGYTPSQTLGSYLQSAFSDEGNLVTSFKNVFNDPDAKILQAINKVSSDVYSMTDAGKAEAAAKIAAEKKRQEEAAAKAKAAAAAAQAKKNSSSSSSSSSSGNYSDTDLKKIAAAIWIWGGATSRWGDDPERRQKLTQKLGSANAAKVQSYINSQGPNGQLYNAYWGQRNALKSYFYGAFAKGTKSVVQDQLAWTQENIPEMIVRKSDGAVLTKLNRGDTVFNGAATSTLFSFGNDPAKFLQNYMPTIPTAKSGGNTSNFDISINVPNVTNYKEFLSAMQNDKQFTSLVQELTLGAASGHNSLKKHAITIR